MESNRGRQRGKSKTEGAKPDLKHQRESTPSNEAPSTKRTRSTRPETKTTSETSSQSQINGAKSNQGKTKTATTMPTTCNGENMNHQKTNGSAKQAPPSAKSASQSKPTPQPPPTEKKHAKGFSFKKCNCKFCKEEVSDSDIEEIQSGEGEEEEEDEDGANWTDVSEDESESEDDNYIPHYPFFGNMFAEFFMNSFRHNLFRQTPFVPNYFNMFDDDDDDDDDEDEDECEYEDIFDTDDDDDDDDEDDDGPAWWQDRSSSDKTRKDYEKYSMVSKTLFAEGSGEVRTRDLPFVVGMKCEDIAKVLMVGCTKDKPSEQKQYLRMLQSRWHPDKFWQKFGDRIDKGGEKEAVMAVVKLVSQSINSYMAKLKK